MLITVNRYSFDEATLGRMYIDGIFECYTLEPKVRTGEPKVPGKTAIPEGHYEVVIDFSNHFQRLMPHILNVPNFEGVRIHMGNFPANTEGCILVGQTVGKDFVGHSVAEFNAFLQKLQSAVCPVFIDINNGGTA